jgi:hypothetical protein
MPRLSVAFASAISANTRKAGTKVGSIIAAAITTHMM